MIYLGNGMYSSSGPDLMHGGPWKTHKYIAIKNGRYIYPGDNPGGRADISGRPQPGERRKKAKEAEKNYKDADEQLRNALGGTKKTQKRVPGIRSVSDILTFGTGGPSQAEKAQRNKDGNSRNVNGGKADSSALRSRNKKWHEVDNTKVGGTAEWETRHRTHSGFVKKQAKYNDSVTNQGPSQAEKAQRNTKGGSRNTETKTTGEKVKGSIKKGVKAVDKGISDGVNALKKAIIGEEGKVVTQKSKKKKKK